MGIMSELDLYSQTIEAIRKEMQEPILTPEEQVERRMDYVLRELDEFMAMSAKPETVGLIEKNKRLMGQIMTRTQLIGSFLLAREQKPGLRSIRNG